MMEFIRNHPIASLFIFFFLWGLIPKRSISEQHKINRNAQSDYDRRIDDHRRNSGQR